MSLWPSFRNDIAGWMPTNLNRGGWLNQHAAWTPTRLNAFGTLSQTASCPEGAFPAAPTCFAPIVAGGMSVARIVPTLTGSANLLQGGPMEGATSFTLTADGSASITVGLDGSATLTLTGDNSLLALTIGLDGSATFTLTGDASNLAMIVPIGDATGIITLSGSANLKGLLSMSGESTPFEELSPTNLARAVWERAVEAGYTAEQMLRIIAAVQAGDGTGMGSNPSFKGLDGSTTRVAGTISGETRTITAVNGA